MDQLLLLTLGVSALHTPQELYRVAYAAHLDAWSLPALVVTVLASAAATAWSTLEVTRCEPRVGQVWADTARAIRGLTIRITAVTPGRAQAVIASPPRAALHDTTGRVMELAAGRNGLRGFRLIGDTATDQGAHRGQR